ncbi:phosphohydrolase [soil metagenome]
MDRTEQLVEAVKPHYAQNDPAHDLSHALRVTKLARQIAQVEGGDLDIIVPAALCHDLRRWEFASHSDEMAAFVKDLLLQVGYDASDVDATVRAVQRHSFSAPQAPETLEEKILFDADKLESLGAIGIGRCFAVSGALNQVIVSETSLPLTAQHFLVERMSRTFERLYTPTAKELGRVRHDFLLAFVEQLHSELKVLKGNETVASADDL